MWEPERKIERRGRWEFPETTLRTRLCRRMRFSRFCLFRLLIKLFTYGFNNFTSLAQNCLINIFNTLTLVWFWFLQTAHVGSKLTNLLFIRTSDSDNILFHRNL